MPMTSEEIRTLAKLAFPLENESVFYQLAIALADLTDEVAALRKLVERHDHRVGSLDESPWYTSDPRFRDD